jgi:hypothetical protein
LYGKLFGFIDRVDPQDRGGEYRSLLGLPGGTSHPSYSAVEDAATKAGFKLLAGKGNDPDTLGKQMVFVYDTKEVRNIFAAGFIVLYQRYSGSPNSFPIPKILSHS